MVSTLAKQDLNIIVGPSKKDHNFLMKNYLYYKKSLESKLFAFCSDVWRFYMLSKSEGLYIDANEIVGKDFYKYFNDFEKYDGVFIRGSSHDIGSSFLYSTKNSFEIFKKALNYYKYFDNEFVRTFPISPHVITYTLHNLYEPGFEDYKNKKLLFKSFLCIRDKNRYSKIGSASWTNNFDAKKYSSYVERKFIKKSPWDSKADAKYYYATSFPRLNIYGLRDEYELNNNKKDLYKLRKIYKNSKQKKF